MTDSVTRAQSERHVDMIVVGAGFAGLYMLYRARELGLSVRVLERGGDVGGTWYWNRYPGARCDVESVDYSYSFSEELQQEWSWSERFATQPEILAYIRHVADRFDLRRDISFDSRLTSARFDEAEERWTVKTLSGDGGTEDIWSATFCVMATGALSIPSKPDFPGLNDFAGEWFQTSRWPHTPVDFTGKKVGVIGTGSSGIQCIPEIARQAERLTVFQRTPNFSLPARNVPWDPAALQRFKAGYAQHRAKTRRSKGGIPTHSATGSAMAATPQERAKAFDAHWERGGNGITMLFDDLMISEEANSFAADYVREKIRAMVDDPATAALLCPTDHPLGAKRVCLDSGYYTAFNRPNVRLVDLRTTPIERITEHGIRLTDGQVDLDAIVFATGFDALTGALSSIDLRGRDGLALSEVWAAGPRTYLGLAVAGFPNLFLLAGAGSPASLTNVVASIEQQVEWVTRCIGWMRTERISCLEAEESAQEEWVAHVYAAAEKTLMMKADSWYLGANVPGKPRVFMPYVGGLDTFGRIIDEVADSGYRGFRRSCPDERTRAKFVGSEAGEGA